MNVVNHPLCESRLVTMSKLKQLVVGLVALSAAPITVLGADTPQSLPLFQLSDMQYIGGFKVPYDDLGESNATYAEGLIGLGAGGNSLYMVGHPYQQAIAEFKIPTLVNSQNIGDFNRATVVQNFSQVLNRPVSGNTQNMDRIGGLAYINGRLVVNTYIYYDAMVMGTNTTLVVKDASKLSTSEVGGYHSYSARAHATGWISPVPSVWQSLVGGTHIAGDSSGKAIISRLSVGPSAFAFNPTSPDIGTLAPSTIGMTTLLDYNLDNPLGISKSAMSDPSTYLFNGNKTNDLWTHMSRAFYGFIVPGTRTYMTVGVNGGMTSGIGYKITQDNGYVCGGYCAYSASDYANYYWLYDMNDLLKVKAGQIPSYSVMPYAYGKLPSNYPQSGFNGILGATFDPAKSVLYMSLERGETLPYNWAPTVVAFKINVSGSTVIAPPSPPPSGSAVQVQP